MAIVGKDDHMDKRTCSIAGCEGKYRSRGLCGTHYNQTYIKVRHKKKPVPCAWCGVELLRSSGGGRKYGYACSSRCRQWLATPYSILPVDHWARWYGKSSKWAAPVEPRPRFTCNTCKECGTSFIDATTSVSAYCSNRCQNRVSRRARTARERGSDGTFRWVEVVRLWVSAGKMCAYCDEVMDGQPDPDHVTPISRGGANHIGNILPCCRACNTDKSDLTLEEWAIERARLGKEPRRYHLPPSDPRFKHLVASVATGSAYRYRRSLAA